MSHIDTEKYDPSKEPAGDTIHMLARAAIGMMPVGSGTVLEALNLVFAEPQQRRRTQWLYDLSAALNKVIDEVESIKNNRRREDAVLSSILHSTDIAVRTGDPAIHERLISIVLNTIKDQDPSEDLLSLYLWTIREMTSSHLGLLDLISARQKYAKGSDLANQERLFFEEIGKHAAISPNIPANRLLKDLESLSLIHSPDGSPWSSNHTNYCTMEVTSFGEGFVRHIATRSD